VKVNQKILLRGWQKEGFQTWLNNNLNGIFSVVTGGGKTIFGIYCLSYLFENNLIDSVVIIVPTKTLQDQWASNILQNTNCLRDEISFNRKKLNKINILTNLSVQKINFKLLKNRYSLILDECHRYGTEKNANFLKENFVSKIGLTATLERKYDDGVEKYLYPNIGKIIYSYTIKQALVDGVVEPYKLVYLRTHFTGDEQIEYDDLSHRISVLWGRFSSEKNSNSKESLKKSIKMLSFKRSRLVNESEQRKYVASRLILNNLKRKKIIFCESIKQSEEIREICEENGLSTVVYHSKMKQSDRISVLNDFQSDYYHTLIGCKALDEGFDVPDIDFGLIVSQTKTNRQRIQRLGRTIRKSKNKQKPIIYTLYTTEDEYSSLYEEQFNNPEIEIEWKEVN
jgi:superfamily II DNA or RNA helicase